MVSGCSAPWCCSRSRQRGLEHRDGVGGLPGRLVGRGQPVPGHHGVGVGRAEQPGAGGHHGLPVRDGRLGQPAVLERQPGAEQQRMSLRLPQQAAVGRPQRRGAVAQGLLELCLLELGLPSWPCCDLARAVAVRPGLQQRVRGGQHHLLQVGGRQVGPHRGLHAGVHLHGAHRADRVDGDQAGLGQVVDGGADHVLVGRVGGARPAGDVAAGGRAGQHGARHAVVIEHRGQHQRRPGQPGRRQLVRALRGDGPGGQHRGRRARHGGHVPIRSASSARYSRQPCLRALIAAVAWASASGSPSRSSPRSSASIRWSG